MPKHTLIVLSDLHLSAVQDGASSPCVARQGFHYDAAFSHFIDDLLARGQAQGAECELLMLGDFLDFHHTEVPLTEHDFLTTTEASGLQKVRAIICAHPVFFEALQRLAAAGFRISVLPGNHDMDLMRPAVQQVLQDTVNADPPGDISFHSWIYYIPGVLYAEHGHQYHDINAFTTLLTPFRRDQGNELELPVGAYFDMYLFRLIERLNPAATNVHAPLRYLLRSYLHQPLKLITTSPDLLRLSFAMLGQFLYRSSRQFRAARRTYRERVLSGYAASTGLSYPTCVALDQLAEVNNSRMLKRLVGSALSQKRRDPIRDGYLYSKALTISSLLRQEGKDVSFYLFGHSHQAARVALDGQVDAFYLNSGTWSSPSYPGSPGDRSRFPFVEIQWENNARPTAALMQWDETRRTSAPSGQP